MEEATLISGKQIADTLAKELEKKIKSETGKPHLAIILVGNDPASEQYVSLKQKRGQSIGMDVTIYRFSNTITYIQLEEALSKLNADSAIHGIIIQLPLPDRLMGLLDDISPVKDVDRLSHNSLGEFLKSDSENCQNCAPAVTRGILSIIEMQQIDLIGKTVTVVGNSPWVGLSIAIACSKKGATVIACSENTTDLASKTVQADILISATGFPKLISKEMVKENAIVIDVGTGVDPKTGKITGDVDFETVKHKASFITPVPGGVGPMTVISLLESTYEAYKLLQEPK